MKAPILTLKITHVTRLIVTSTNGASVAFLSFSLLRTHENMQRAKLLEGLRWECIIYIRLPFIF